MQTDSFSLERSSGLASSVISGFWLIEYMVLVNSINDLIKLGMLKN
jgi:hypothetical protein